MLSTILTVENSDLFRLNPEEAVKFFRKILWAEAMRVKIPLTKITVTTKIYIPDGGIDASVDRDVVIQDDSFIQSGLNGFQIKAGEVFEPWQDVAIRKELFGKKSVARKNLGESIRNVLDSSGRYVIVCFKQELTDPQRRQAVDSLKYYLRQCDYNTPSVDVWDSSHLLGLLNYLPALSLEANGCAASRFQTHTSWSLDAEMRKEFFPGVKQKEFISNLQIAIRDSNKSIHMRIFGRPGDGKTRLVLEATATEDLKPLVIYCGTAGEFKYSDLMNELLKEDKQFTSVLIIDECDAESRALIWDKLQYRNSLTKLITIYNEYDNAIGTTTYFETPSLEKEQISKIIQSYKVPKDQADRWTDFCDGSPREAHDLGLNLMNNPQDLLRSPDTTEARNRRIAGGDDPKSVDVQQRRTVLLHLALFKRFGFGRGLSEESTAIAKFIMRQDSNITLARFQQIVKRLRDRKILQGENTLYITPKIFHIWLWSEWWEIHGNTFNFEEFSKDFPPPLLKWFVEMFKYASESQISSKVVRELLGPNGPFQKSDYLRSEIGSDFFLALTEADPKSALECLQATVGTWSKEELLEFTTGRRNIVWALERIAIHRELFVGAARSLLALGEAENETWSNNASGVFAGLFSPGRSSVAPTQASPEERFPTLKEALISSSKERRKLGLKACNGALQTHSFVRTVGAEYQGLKEVKDRWSPKTYGELFDAYRRVWKLIIELLPQMEEGEQEEATNVLLRHARGLISISNLAEMVIDSLQDLVKRSLINRKIVLEEIIRILHYDSKEMEVSVRERLERLNRELTGEDFSSMLKRYVGMQLLEDEYDSQGNRIDATQRRISELASAALKNPFLFDQELEWLVTDEAQNGFAFGYELGKFDGGFSLLDSLISKQRNVVKKSSVYFLSGYFRALFEKDKERWEKELEILSKDKILCQWVPELTWRSGMTDTAASRVLQLAEEGKMKVSDFRMFTYGGVVKEFSEDVFLKWISFLLKTSDEQAVLISVDLFAFYYIFKEKKNDLPEIETFQLLTHQSLISKSVKERHRQMIDYNWTQIAKGYIGQYPSKSQELANFMLEHFGEVGSIFEGYHSSTLEVLNEITGKYPESVWSQVKRYLGPPLNSREFHIRQWLRGDQTFRGDFEFGALSVLPSEEIFKWVNEDIENRAWYLASFVPPVLHRRGNELCLAREVLIRYGEREDVKRNLIANFSTEGWVGPESLHHQDKRDQLLEIKKEEPNDKVKSWIEYYVSILDYEIDRARIREEREDF